MKGKFERCVRLRSLPSLPCPIMNKATKVRRPSARQRGYDRRWDKARAAFLREPENRFCRKCRQQGRMTAATVVDHIVPHRGDPALFWDRSNWQPLCKPHHDSAKQREERGRFVEIDDDGWPVEHQTKGSR